MLNSQRSFVSVVKAYCAEHGIEVEVRSQGWLLVMRRGDRRRFALGYDLGLNSSATHRIANDKAATAEVLELCGVPCVPHTLVLSPKLSSYVPAQGTWETMLALLNAHPGGIVVKPNEGTGGQGVFRVRDRAQLEIAVHEIFLSERSLAISPYLNIDAEVRVVLVEHAPMVVYSKQRPAIVGDGVRTLLQLAMATVSQEQLPQVLVAIAGELTPADLDMVLPAGERRTLNWRHNLASGASPEVLEHGAVRDACVAIAVAAATAIGLRFGSIDVVLVDGEWKILEINSGVMMEAFGRSHPDLVEATYRAALDLLFADDVAKPARAD
jgi:glutathione synthase/RimK-type ligase-like ATP-grasp enzyme